MENDSITIRQTDDGFDVDVNVRIGHTRTEEEALALAEGVVVTTSQIKRSGNALKPSAITKDLRRIGADVGDDIGIVMWRI